MPCPRNGLLIEKELSFLDRLIHEPAGPFYAVLGGSKVSDKIRTIELLFSVVDGLVIGGAMAHAFWAVQGDSIPEGAKAPKPADIEAAPKIIAEAKRREVPLMVPADTIQGFDIGPKTIERFCQFLSDAKTIFWNGPLGWFERPEYAEGTFAVARRIASLAAVKVVGGGDTVSAIKQSGLPRALTTFRPVAERCWNTSSLADSQESTSSRPSRAIRSLRPSTHDLGRRKLEDKTTWLLAAAQFIDKLHSDWERGLSERTCQRLAAGQVKALIFPPALSIATCSELVRNTGLPIHLGTQNAHGEKSGAYTGEISVSMLQEAILPSRGIVLVGHSERRQLFGEMPEATWQRTLGIMNQGATVLFCVGETQKEREAGQTRSVLHAQLKGLTLGNDAQNRGRLMIAYELRGRSERA